MGKDAHQGAARPLFPDATPSPAQRPASGRKGRRSCRHKDKSPRDAATSAHGPKSAIHSEGYGSWSGRPVPKHVAECWHGRDHWTRSTRDQSWWIWSWHRERPEVKTRRPYCCGSWRCDGECAGHAAHVLFARLDAATRALPAEGWIFAVLTLDQLGSLGGRPWPDEATAYRALSRASERWLKRVRRLCERRGWRPPGSEWVIVVEAHRSGYPHCNLLVWAPELAEELERDAELRRVAGFVGDRLATFGLPGFALADVPGIRGELGRHAVACDWGPIGWVERARSPEALAGYLVKLSRRPDETVGELAKLCQLPTNAPFRFRRLRSGKGFLPPISRSETTTGALVKRVIGPDGLRWATTPRPRAGAAPERELVLAQVEDLEDSVMGLEERAVAAHRSGRRPILGETVSLVSVWVGAELRHECRPPAELAWQLVAQWGRSQAEDVWTALAGAAE